MLTSNSVKLFLKVCVVARLPGFSAHKPSMGRLGGGMEESNGRIWIPQSMCTRLGLFASLFVSTMCGGDSTRACVLGVLSGRDGPRGQAGRRLGQAHSKNLSSAPALVRRRG